MNVFIVLIPHAEQERNRNMRIRNGLNNFFVCALSNGNRTEWSPIRSVFIRVINKIGRPRSGSLICLITSMIM